MSRTADDCLKIEPLLDDLVDGVLSAADQRRVEAHLAVCEECAEQLASLRALLRQVDALPRSKTPASDLWSGIEPRLTRRTVARPGFTGVAEGATADSLRRWPGWLRQAAAALVFMALGGVLSQVLWPAVRSQPVAPSAGIASGDERVVDSRGVDFAVAEADFLRAKEALWSAVYTSREATSPATREVVERNLRVIAGAIRELRAALAADPGNQQLEGMLLAQHRTEIDLLRRLARPMATQATEQSTNT